MIVAKHPDGRVLILASSGGLPPMVRTVGGTWVLGDDLPTLETVEFEPVNDPKERVELLTSAQRAIIARHIISQA